MNITGVYFSLILWSKVGVSVWRVALFHKVIQGPRLYCSVGIISICTQLPAGKRRQRMGLFKPFQEWNVTLFVSVMGLCRVPGRNGEAFLADLE